MATGCVEPCSSTDDTADYVEAIVSCRDFDPCTIDSFTEQGGCAHVAKANGDSCFANDGVGECINGLCVFTRDDFSEAVCVDASRECHGLAPYIVSRLDGSCLIEWCNFDEPGRSLRPKPSGSPCVKTLAPGTPEFVVGQCGPCGECF